MKDKQSAVLWEHTWTATYDFGPSLDAERSYTYDFRIVGQTWEHDDGVRRLGALRFEELSEDAMGTPSWVPMRDEAIPETALAALLVKAGVLPPDTDLSDIAT